MKYKLSQRANASCRSWRLNPGSQRQSTISWRLKTGKLLSTCTESMICGRRHTGYKHTFYICFVSTESIHHTSVKQNTDYVVNFKDIKWFW